MPLTQPLKDAAHNAVAAWPSDVPERSPVLTAVDAAVIPTPPVGPVMDPLLVYDVPAQRGQLGGVTFSHLYAGWLPWKNKGGDWLDADNIPQGVRPFAEATLAVGQTGEVKLDISALVKMDAEPTIMLHGVSISASGATFVFNSRESGLGPKLLVDYDDGTSETVPCVADVETNASTAYEIGGNPSYTIGPLNTVYVRFPPLTKPVTKAVLDLTIVKIYVAGKLQVMRFALHRDAIPTETFNLKGDPRVFIETESFEKDVPDYLHHMLYGGWPDKSIWLDPYQQRNVVDTDAGRALQVTFDPRANGACNASILFPGYKEATEIAWEFEARYLPDMLTGMTDGFKFFAGCSSLTKNDDAYTASICGFPAGRCGTLLAGNGGSKAHGYDGWSLRHDAWRSPPLGHPLYGHYPPMQYAYWPEQKDFYGDPIDYNLAGFTPKVNEWFKISQRAKCNDADATTFQKNAELDGYINGMLACRWRNFYLRTTNQPLIAYAPYNVQGAELKIGRIWINSYHGGTLFPAHRCSFQIRNFRAAVFA